MRIVFMGSPEFAVPSLLGLHEAGHEIAMVVSAPDRRRHRRSAPAPTPVRACALELGLPTLQVDDLRSESFARELARAHAELFVVVAFRVLPASVLALAPRGAVNLHASLLPRYRGAAPIHHAILAGETRTGCTVFQLDEGVDTGGILLRRETPIGPDETTGDLYERLRLMGADLLVQAVDGLQAGTLSPEPQRPEQACPAPKVFAADGRIDPDLPPQRVHDRIRAMTPAPGAWLEREGGSLRVLRSARLTGPTPSLPPPGSPGELRLVRLAPEDSPDPAESPRDALLLACRGGWVELRTVQPPDRRPMAGADFARGYLAAR